MKNLIVFILLMVMLPLQVNCQVPVNDEPCSSIALTVNPDQACGFITSSSTQNSTATGGVTNTCIGTADDDVWFSFVATDVVHTIDILNATGTTDMYHAVYSGGCTSGSLTNLSCNDADATIVSGLTLGQTYYLQVYTWSSTGLNTGFDICIGTVVPTCSDGIMNQNEQAIDCGGVCPACPVPTVQDCLGAIQINQATYFETNSYSGTGAYPNEINPVPSCLGTGEKNDVWYTFTTKDTGNLCLSIIPNLISDDYDWAIYNLTDANCSDIYNSPSLEVSCNYSGIAGVTGPNGLTGNQSEPCLSVLPCETYVLNVSQYSPSVNGYTLQIDNPNLVNLMMGFDSMETVCDSLTGEYTLSGNYLTTNAPSTGDLVIYNCMGDSLVYSTPFSDTISFQFTGSSGMGLCWVDAYYTDTVQCSSPYNYMSPSNCFCNTITYGFLSTASATTTCVDSCSGTISVLTMGGTPPYIYNWDNLPAETNSFVDSLCSASYSVSVVDSLGCAISVSETVSISQSPQNYNISNDTSVLLGDSIQLCVYDTANSILSYLWSTGEQTSCITVSPTDPSTYNVFLSFCSGTIDDSVVVMIDLTAAINTNSFVKEVVITPNPTRNEINILGLQGETGYKIIDLNGKVVKQGKTENFISFNLAKGVYFIYLEGYSSKKIVVEN